jgi:hypothetical protein
MTLSNTIKKQREEVLPKDRTLDSGSFLFLVKDIQSELISAFIEEVEEKKRKDTVRLLDGTVVTTYIDQGYNLALSELIDMGKKWLIIK